MTKPPRVLSIPAGRAAAARLTGLPRGRYAIDVDGAPQGTLVIGTQPGP